jgi:pilus assembly protein CpaB
MNRRALLIALIVSILGAALVAVYLRRFEQEASGGEPLGVIVLLKPVESGDVLTDDVLATRLIPRAYVEDRAVLAKDKPKVLGLRMGHALEGQQALMWTDLAIAMEERRNLSSLIQPGMRAATIGASNRGGGNNNKANALIRPGDRIDVIATVSADPKKTNEGDTSVVLLQNVLVLAVGTDTGSDVVDKSAREAKNLQLTLSVTVPETQLLALASERGTLSVALRNPDDIRIIDSVADVTAAALSDVNERGLVQGVRKTGQKGLPEKLE